MKKFALIALLIGFVGCDATNEPSSSSSDMGTVATDSQDPDSSSDLIGRTHLQLVGSASGRTLELAYEPADAVQPRVAELRVQLSSDVTFVSATAGDALTDAGKNLISQVEPGNIVRLVALSAGSAETIGGGTLATISISRSGSGPSSAKLLLDRPLFAPAEANDGLLVDGDVTF